MCRDKARPKEHEHRIAEDLVVAHHPGDETLYLIAERTERNPLQYNPLRVSRQELKDILAVVEGKDDKSTDG